MQSLTRILVLLFCWTTLYADQEMVDLQELHRVSIEYDRAGLLVEAPFTPQFEMLLVIVYNQQGQRVIETRTKGEPVDIFAGELPDGRYTLHAHVMFQADVLAVESQNRHTDDAVMTHRTVERFRIVNGEYFRHGEKIPERDEQASINPIIWLLDQIVPSAHAVDLTITDPTPGLIFEDTTTAGDDWFIRGREEFFSIVDVPGNNDVLEFIPGANNDNSIVVDSSGDVRLASDGIVIDRSTGNVGFGTFPVEDLHIFDFSPALRLEDSSDSQRMSVKYDSNSFQIEDNGGEDIVSIHENAPTSSLVITNNGNIGIGTSDPAQNLEIEAFQPIIILDTTEPGNVDYALINATDDFQIEISNNDAGGPTGTAFQIDSTNGNFGIWTFVPEATLTVQSPAADGEPSILVNNRNPVEGPRELFELRNAGNTKFIITNTQAVDPSSWGFTNNGDDFRISYQGSGVVEMQVFQGGNVTIDGTLTENSDRNAKQAIRDIDQQQVLNKVMALDISRWQYKDTPDVDHIGPMAQDFHAAFGLGETDTGIASLDSAGVALAAIQALATKNEELEQQNRQLRAGHRQLLAAYHQQETRYQSMLDAQQAFMNEVQAYLQQAAEPMLLSTAQ